MARTVRIGVLGAGSWARHAHLPGYAREPRCKVVAIADPQVHLARAAARDFGVAVTTADHREVITRDLGPEHYFRKQPA